MTIKDIAEFYYKEYLNLIEKEYDLAYADAIETITSSIRNYYGTNSHIDVELFQPTEQDEAFFKLDCESYIKCYWESKEEEENE